MQPYTGVLALMSIESPPRDDYEWDGEWSIDKDYTACDQAGWTYGLSWWMLSLRLRHGNSLRDPSMTLVRRRRWVRHLRVVRHVRACVGGNFIAAVDSSRKHKFDTVASTSALQSRAAAATTTSICTPPAALATCARRSSDESLMGTICLHGFLREVTPKPVVSPQAESPTLADLPSDARCVLTSHALQAIKLAEDMMQHSDPSHVRRWFHAAAVYFEVIRSFGDLSPELDSQRQRVRRLARLCSHLHENCVTEYDTSSLSVTDMYELPADMILGRGSYGIVSLAIHKWTRQEYACKVLSFDEVGPHNVLKLHSEISSMRQLDHPNVLRLREVFFGHRRIYLIMDLCKGGELFELVNASSEHRTEQCAIRFLTQMFSAVQYLHINGVMHRDLKLENWLFEQRSGSHLKLIDFGLACHFRGHERICGAVGSMYYVAPEVLMGSYDARCDIWSLGVIAYMLVSGAPPFWGKNDHEIRSNILTGLWDFPQHFFSDVSPLAKDFIARLLQHDPERRMSIKEALAHNWLRINDNLSTQSRLTLWQREELLRILCSFASTSPLQKIVLQVIAFQLTPSEVAAARRLFILIDIDHSGTLSLRELIHAFHVAPGTTAVADEALPMDKATLAVIFQGVGISPSSEITFTEFLAATLWPQVQLDEVRARHIFNALDTNRDGRLSAASFKNLVGIDYADDVVNDLITGADGDGDGFLNYDDFLSAWRSCEELNSVAPQTKCLNAHISYLSRVCSKGR